ncbi:ABC transporter permease [Falsarthrobacter nasiphocae]|uniref:Oligopeptide transport system permease protein OppC n=1 Tax=Falsarthrobacter nasiphocae TaxID=189863 RepID=A0AAE4C7E3_9MICC|nr:ABC transporter permease [Falsarthrobacter nasiphocae]MDR6892464.1 peptide/nickel transport system permease protein [Falsarthrobacter nasiphocae]
MSTTQLDALENEQAAENIQASEQNDGKVLGKATIIIRRFFRNIPAAVGLVIFLLVCLFAIFGPLFTKWEVAELDFVNTASRPMEGHPLGTNIAGADMLAQLVQGTRISLVIGLVVGLSSAFIAAIYGCVAAYNQGRWIEKVLMAFLELMILAPSFLIIAIMANGRGGSWILLMFLLVVFGWMGPARLVRGLSSSLIDREFVKAARYMGVPPFKIVMRHLMPNIASQVVLSATMGIWSAILSEVTFSFLGIGVKLPDTSLGLLIGQSSDALQAYPWMFWEPVIMLLLITGPLSLINDGLRDAFDPTSASSGKAKKKK